MFSFAFLPFFVRCLPAGTVLLIAELAEVNDLITASSNCNLEAVPTTEMRLR